MNGISLRLWMLGCAAALFICTAFAAPQVAMAQDDNVPVCCDVTYTNNTACPIRFCLRTASGPVCVNVPANSTVVMTLPASLCGNPSIYTHDRCGNEILLPVTGCVNAVDLSRNCCAQLCLTSGFAGCWFVTANPVRINCLCDHADGLSLLGR